MGTKRQSQTGEVIRRHFSEVLQQEGRYIYGEAMVTVTMVKMSSDLGLAKIYLSVFNAENKEAIVALMEKENKKLRQALAARVRHQMRRVPNIDFYIDETLDEMYRLNDMFDKLHDNDQMGSEEE